MSSFELDLAKFGQKALGDAEKVVRKIALDMHSRIVERSPVDTGRFRANNSISIGHNPGGASMDTDIDGSTTIAKAESSVSAFQLGQSVVIYNNTEYALPLEYGHSKQAPQGLFRISFNDVVTHLGATIRSVARG